MKSCNKEPKPKLTRIHVNQHVIKANLKTNDNLPAITVKTGKQNLYGHTVKIFDDQGNVVAIVTQPKDKKLSCGARVWIETRNKVEVIDEESN
jgi:hypothetical protein